MIRVYINGYRIVCKDLSYRVIRIWINLSIDYIKIGYESFDNIIFGVYLFSR